MSPCHNLEPSLVARDSSRLLSVKPNEWMHLSPFYTRMHGEWLRYAKSTSQFHWRFLLVRDVRGFQVNPLCRHDITSPFPPSGNGGYVRNLDDLHQSHLSNLASMISLLKYWHSSVSATFILQWQAVHQKSSPPRLLRQVISREHRAELSAQGCGVNNSTHRVGSVLIMR